MGKKFTNYQPGDLVIFPEGRSVHFENNTYERVPEGSVAMVLQSYDPDDEDQMDLLFFSPALRANRFLRMASDIRLLKKGPNHGRS